MNCENFEKYELGEIGSREFGEHIKECAHCREKWALDKELMSLSLSLKQPVRAPLLWERIQQRLEEENEDITLQQQHKETSGKRIFKRPAVLWLAASVCFMAIALAMFFWLFQEKQEPGLLTRAALKQVESKEQEYINAIRELERQTQPKMASLNIELVLLYRDRLETIDNQIKRCKEALMENPSNTHIRRYLLAALQDKKQTLHELLDLQMQDTSHLNDERRNS